MMKVLIITVCTLLALNKFAVPCVADSQKLSNENDKISTKSINIKPCGIRKQISIDTLNSNGNVDYAVFGEFPWMVEVLKRNYSSELRTTLAVSGGVIISPKVILTTAHGVIKLKSSDIKVRAGEWNTQNTDEALPHQERNVVEIIIHNDYDRKNLYNNIALLVLSDPFEDADNIATICLPPQDLSFESNHCVTTGWNKDTFGREGVYSVVLKKQDVTIVPHSDCEKSLQETRLGNHFKLHDTCICTKHLMDTCSAEASSLVCPDPNHQGRYLQAGIISWKLGCLQTETVYMNVAKFRNWIDEEMKKLNFDTTSYTN